MAFFKCCQLACLPVYQRTNNKKSVYNRTRKNSEREKQRKEIDLNNYKYISLNTLTLTKHLNSKYISLNPLTPHTSILTIISTNLTTLISALTTTTIFLNKLTT